MIKYYSIDDNNILAYFILVYKNNYVVYYTITNVYIIHVGLVCLGIASSLNIQYFISTIFECDKVNFN